MEFFRKPRFPPPSPLSPVSTINPTPPASPSPQLSPMSTQSSTSCSVSPATSVVSESAATLSPPIEEQCTQEMPTSEFELEEWRRAEMGYQQSVQRL